MVNKWSALFGSNANRQAVTPTVLGAGEALDGIPFVGVARLIQRCRGRGQDAVSDPHLHMRRMSDVLDSVRAVISFREDIEMKRREGANSGRTCFRRSHWTAAATAWAVQLFRLPWLRTGGHTGRRSHAGGSRRGIRGAYRKSR